MLGRTANGLFWMYRYLERAENTARLIETGQRIALTRLDSTDDEWRSVLKTAGVFDGFGQLHDNVTKDAAIDWLLRARDNPSSVYSCICAARQNARSVRTALTGEVWEAVNRIYMSAQDVLARKVSERDLPKVLGQIRQGTALVRGSTLGTMLRNDFFDFARIGTFLERADQTARILDVKYYVLLPSVRSVGSSIDNVQWEIILRSVSARGGFRVAYDNAYDPKDIARFLILDGRMPRSLQFCLSKLDSNLTFLANTYGTEPAPALLKVRDMRRGYLDQDIEHIFELGLHEFLQTVLNDLAGLGRQIEVDYRFYE
ncbi:alpha-E domain-containing protein [Cognatishimia sp. F0-27]|uniref:alpha-E domain-containing protein n=1 Tax=Cognatishimia sp. F0-27 TaxID=2816855 RepID=UPI001D0C2A24|nr:alpha-E domain-containing protein [Cognatishimia sp. F0-27]MCC1492880.1 alpha-E domain-containing protein [Cognatishimia sp. F0-27]